jgi:hypothetical protein
LKAREALARKEKTAVTPDTEDEGVLVGLAGLHLPAVPCRAVGAPGFCSALKAR